MGRRLRTDMALEPTEFVPSSPAMGTRFAIVTGSGLVVDAVVVAVPALTGALSSTA